MNDAVTVSTLLEGSESPWARIVGPSLSATVLPADTSARFAIVGAGFAGLSLAYHLAQHCPAEDIVVVDAGPIGAGASGRNSGMVGPGVWGPYQRMESRFGKPQAAAMFRHTTEAVELAIALIEREKLDCDLVVGSQYRTAMTDRQAFALEQERAALRDAGFDMPMLDTHALEKVVRSDAYLCALQYRRAATINPLKLTEALIAHLTARGVRIYHETPVLSIDAGKPALLRTPRGTIRAEQLLLATNAYTSLLGKLTQRVVPLVTQMMLTERLSEERLKEIGMSRRTAIIDSRRLFSFYRLTADNRIAFGGGRVAYKPFKGTFPQVFANPVDRPAVNGLLQDFHSIFPQLASSNIDYAWRGSMGFTIDNLPIVGRLEAPNIYFCGAWCGHGLALSMANGARLAGMIVNGLGSEARTFPWDRNSCMRLPRPSILKQGLKIYLSGLSAGDRAGVAWQKVKATVGGSQPFRPRGNWTK